MRHAFRTQANLRIHTAIAALVVVLGLWLRLPRQDWATLVLAMAFVLVAEIANTALEALTDLKSPEFHPLARVAKDVGAAAVLTAAVASIVIGLLVLGPPLLCRIRSLWMK